MSRACTQAGKRLPDTLATSYSHLTVKHDLLTDVSMARLFFGLWSGDPVGHTGDRFLNGFEENVISGQRSIRIFGKRFMESEMTSILVQGGRSRTEKVVFSKNHDSVNRKFNSKFQAFCWF